MTDTVVPSVMNSHPDQPGAQRFLKTTSRAIPPTMEEKLTSSEGSPCVAVGGLGV